MNRMNVRQRRSIFINATTVLLFACLLTGVTTSPLITRGAEQIQQQTTDLPAASIAWVKRDYPLMPGTSFSMVMALQEEQTQKNASKEESQSPKVADAPEMVASSVAPAPQLKIAPLVAKNVTTAKPKPLVAEERKGAVRVTSTSAEPSGFTYNPAIPMPKDHQSLLFKLCQERNLDYKKALAVIQHESGYDSNNISPTNDYGYFQVNKVNHADLAKKLDTPNKPLDPYINLDWGTFMLSDLYAYWQEKGISGERLDEYVWSSYNKGIGGFQKYGKATAYIQRVREALDTL